jgi:hypothetical protein
MRLPVLIIAVLFIAGLGALTVIDISRYGITILSALAILVLVLFMIGIVGALREPPRE